MATGRTDLQWATAWAARQPDVQAWVKDVCSRFVAVSKPLADWCAARTGDMTGCTELDFFPPERVAAFRCDDRRAIARNERVIVEEVSPGGRYVTVKQPVFDGRGRVIGTLGVARRWPPREPAPAAGAVRPTPGWLAHVRERMELEFRTPLTVRGLAAEVRRHPNHLSRAFTQWFGLRPIEWLHRLRIEWAANALATGNTPLGQIAQTAGFADQPHLTRVFKRYFGVTPAFYRQAMRRPDV